VIGIDQLTVIADHIAATARNGSMA